MRRRPTLGEFLTDPIGSCVAGRCWLYFYPDAGLTGFLLWGEPAVEDIERLGEAIDAEIDAPAHVSLIDVSAVTGGDPVAFGKLQSYAASRRARLARSVERAAIVRGSGVLGALASGFYALEPAPYPVELFDSRQRALAWLGASRHFDALAEQEAAVSGPTLLRDLRLHLADELKRATLDSAARVLGRSSRSLQRELSSHGTSFKRELGRVRVHRAQQLLQMTDDKVAHIAREVGCASLPSFIALFRRATGLAPGAWRERTVAERR
jgi:AraC-like DNA-binding protein